MLSKNYYLYDMILFFCDICAFMRIYFDIVAEELKEKLMLSSQTS